MARSLLYIRNLVFGVEDGLVSTVGFLSGIAIADVSRETLLLTGVVLIFVEAVSMAAGSFLSEASVEDFDKRERTKAANSVAAGAMMFVSYVLAGLIPLAPYILFDEMAFRLSITAALASLLLLGLWSGSRSKTGIIRSALRMLLVGGAAIVVGVVAGSLLG